MKLDYFLDNDGRLEIKLKGDYLSYDNNKEQSQLLELIKSKKAKKIDINGEKLNKWDSTLVVIVFEVLKIAKLNSISTNIDTLPEGLKRLINLAFSVKRNSDKTERIEKPSIYEIVGDDVLKKYNGFTRGINFFFGILKSFGRFFSGIATMRKVDFLYALEDAGYKAIPIVSLISFMVGLILAFVGAIQLKAFGAQIYVASLVAIGMVRIMGPAMAGVIMAGRTGASYAATIGTMQVNEEIDALKTMGIPIMDFLTLPRFLAMTFMMPLLSMFADIMGIIGGASVGTTMLGIPFQEYWKLSIQALDLKNFLIGIFHGYVYGWVISLCGCYYGIYCGKDADSVGKATTMAVVAAIVWIVITTGIITFICQVIGI